MSARTDRLRAVLEEAARHSRLAVTGHERPDADALISCALARDLLSFWGLPGEIVLTTRADAQARRVLPRLGLEPDKWLGELRAEDAVLLVDHHEAPRVGRAVACVDHHLTAYPPDLAYVQIEPRGACAAMLYGLLLEAGATPKREQTALAAAALYLDTVGLRSAKISLEEAEWARRAARKLGMDEAWLEREGMNLTDMSQPAGELIRRGRKAYDFAGRRVLSAHVQTGEMPQRTLDALIAAAREAMTEEGARLFVLLWHDPAAGNTVEYDIYDDGRTKRRDHGRLVSRGRDVMPRVERELLGKAEK